MHNSDLKTVGRTTDWCLNFCDGCTWLMYMAFVFQMLNMENMGRDFPGEWYTADLFGVPMTEENVAALRHEYKRKMLEDGVRKKAERKTKSQKSEEVKSSSGSPHVVFDFGQMVETEKNKGSSVCLSSFSVTLTSLCIPYYL
jgi:hypothetical protein